MDVTGMQTSHPSSPTSLNQPMWARTTKLTWPRVYTRLPCVTQAAKAFSAHVSFELGNNSGVRKVSIINEAYQADVHEVTGPPTPEPEAMYTSRVPF